MQPFFRDYVELLEILHNDFAQAIAGLSVEALDWVPGREMNSLCVLVVHTMGATRYWVGDVAAQIPSNRVRSTEFEAHRMDEAALKQRLDDTLAFVRSTLETFTVQDFDAARTSALHPEEPTTVSWALGHALEHTSLHLGHTQITRQLWEHNYG